MKSYKDPPLHDRLGRGAEAKRKALEQLRARPPIDENAAAERQAVRRARDAAKEKSRAALKATGQLEADDAVRDAEPRGLAAPPLPTRAERKAIRDARYAARKSRR